MAWLNEWISDECDDMNVIEALNAVAACFIPTVSESRANNCHLLCYD
jgi:hypothetical protein